MSVYEQRRRGHNTRFAVYSNAILPEKQGRIRWTNVGMIQKMDVNGLIEDGLLYEESSHLSHANEGLHARLHKCSVNTFHLPPTICMSQAASAHRSSQDG